jgi:hypothetical protein
MRTTLTIESDVAAVLDRLRARHGDSLKDIINEALRRGLREMTSEPKERPSFRTHSVALGPVKGMGIDNIAEALAWAERETYR